MSGVDVIRYLLAHNAPLTAVVPAAQIRAGDLPQGTSLPAISITQVSSVPRVIVNRAAGSEFNTDRVQVTVLAKKYPELRQVLRLVLAACPQTRGTVDSVAVDSVTPDVEGPDFFDEQITAMAGSRDFIVCWTA